MHKNPSKKVIVKTFSTLYDENITVENFLINFFSWSKQFYKKQNFPKLWSEQKVKAKHAYAIPIELINHGKVRAAPREDWHKISILEENDLLLAISKNEKVHSHPLNYSGDDNVLSILLAQGRADLLNINVEHYDRCLLYRLDYETSGLLLAAKNDETYRYIRENFSQVMVQKIYRLKCSGAFKIPHGKWIHWIKPIGKNKNKVEALKSEDKERFARQAELSYRVLSYDSQQDVSEVEVFLKTGLRHQIRVQFSTMGHPIIGDDLYHGQPSGRLYLHAYQYRLLLHQKEMIFTAPLPSNW